MLVFLSYFSLAHIQKQAKVLAHARMAGLKPTPSSFDE
jgi:hypothetical protein